MADLLTRYFTQIRHYFLKILIEYYWIIDSDAYERLSNSVAFV